MKNDQLLFENREAFRKWLFQNHHISPGIWLVLGKAGRLKTLTADEALEEALCFGWIDGQLKSIDDQKYLKRFTPRRKGSVWSERNRKLVKKLIENGTMTEAGQAVIGQAQKQGTWDKPRPAPISETQIEVLIQALSEAEQALANFMKMPLSVKRTYTALYLDAKKEDTRKKRLEKIIERLNENKRPM
jgi:uncharacterized protein YdeI (YjbR/CyaY-like superfamily)